MKPSDEGWYPWLPFKPLAEPGKGWPHAKNEGSGSNFPLLWHPIAYLRWRIAVHRLGPYAPGFKEFRQKQPPDDE
jgi:hypothetical protein